MKRRLMHKGKRVYIKYLTTTYALVSYCQNCCNEVFYMKIEDLARMREFG